jgi:hypothetical protein
VDKSKKTKWKFLELEKYNTQEKRADAWRTWLATHAHQDNAVVPVVFEQHDKNKGCVLPEVGEAVMIAVQKNINVQAMYNEIFKEDKLKSFVLYFRGDTNLSYDGADTPLGKKSISDDSLLFNKKSDDPILKRAVFISYYAEMDNNNILV